MQIDSMSVISEIQLLNSFVLVILSFQIILVFIAQKRSNPDSSAVWIRVFIISSSEFIIIHTIELVFLLELGDAMIGKEIVYRINLIAVDTESMLLFWTIRLFSKKKSVRVNLFSIIFIILYGMVLAVHVIETFSGNAIQILPNSVSTTMMLPGVLIPLGVSVILFKRCEAAIKRYYKTIAISLGLMCLGDTMHLLPVEHDVAVLGISMDFLAAASVFLSLVGTAMLFVSFYMLPYIEDLYWQKEVLSIYVLDTTSNTMLYKETMPENVDASSADVMKSSTSQDRVFLGSLTGLDDFISDVMKSKGNLEYVDKGNLKLLFTRRKNLLFIAAAKKNLTVIKTKLSDFADWFFITFGVLVKNNELDPSKYVKARNIVAQVFKGE